MRVYKSILPSSFLWKGSKKHLGARQRLQQRLLRPLSSSESFEAIWRPFGGQKSLNRGRKHNRGCWLPRKKAFCKLHLIAPHAYLLLPCLPQVLQGHCPLVMYAVKGKEICTAWMGGSVMQISFEYCSAVVISLRIKFDTLGSHKPITQGFGDPV